MFVSDLKPSPPIRYSLGCILFSSVSVQILPPSSLVSLHSLGSKSMYAIDCLAGTLEQVKSFLANKSDVLMTDRTVVFVDEKMECACRLLKRDVDDGDSSRAPSLACTADDQVTLGSQDSLFVLPPLFFYSESNVCRVTFSESSPRPRSFTLLDLSASSCSPPKLPPVVGVAQKSALSTLKEKVTSSLSCPSAPLLLAGASGSGKSTICRNLTVRLCLESSVSCVRVDCAELRDTCPKVNNMLDEMSRKARVACETAPSLLIFDGLDLICPDMSDLDSQLINLGPSMDKAALVADHVLYLIEEVSTGQVCVLFTAKSRDSVIKCIGGEEENLIEEVCNIGSYSGSDRMLIFREVLKLEGLELAKDFDEGAILKEVENCLPSDLVRLAGVVKNFRKLRMLGRFHEDDEDISDDEEDSGDERAAESCSLDRIATGTVQMEDVKRALSNFQANSLKEAKLHEGCRISWDDIGGLFDAKNKLLSVFQNPIRYERIYRNSPIKLPKGGVLYGPTGCGKTMIGSAIARTCGLNFISIKGPEIFDKYIGASEAAVRDIFARAEIASPCLIFFDEFESVGGKRGRDSTGVGDRVVNQLLTFLDGVETSQGQVFVLAATSRLDMIDPALLRPGRLELKVKIDLPSAEERADILKCILKNNKVEVDEDALRRIAADGLLNIETQEGACFNGADIAAICNTAYLKAVHEVLEKERNAKEINREQLVLKFEHFSEAIKDTNPSGLISSKHDEESKKMAISTRTMLM